MVQLAEGQCEADLIKAGYLGPVEAARTGVCIGCFDYWEGQVCADCVEAFCPGIFAGYNGDGPPYEWPLFLGKPCLVCGSTITRKLLPV
jgi:hypothetical protein